MTDIVYLWAHTLFLPVCTFSSSLVVDSCCVSLAVKDLFLCPGSCSDDVWPDQSGEKEGEKKKDILLCYGMQICRVHFHLGGYTGAEQV